MRTIRKMPDGVILILTSGILVLSSLLAVAFMTAARVTSARSTAALSRAGTSLTAESGMSYAAARLAMESGYPRYSTTPLDRGDDWAWRDPAEVPVQDGENCSFSHGDHWHDLAVNGAYDLNEQLSADLDGDERFSAWSGRLRGGNTPFGLTFSLKIEAADGKLPVNMCAVPGIDLFQVNNLCAGVQHALNNLGAIRGLSKGVWNAGVANGTFTYSTLGDDLLADHRPAVGYASSADIRGTMLTLGYSAADFERIAPFLDIGPYQTPPQMSPGLVYLNGGTDFLLAPVPAVNLAVASPEVLESLFRYLTGSDSLRGGATGWGQVTHRRSGLTYRDFISGGKMALTIYADEAAQCADEVREYCRAGSPTWQGLRQRIVDKAPEIFRDDYNDFAGISGLGVLQHEMAIRKAQIVFSAWRLMPLVVPMATAYSTGGVDAVGQDPGVDDDGDGALDEPGEGTGQQYPSPYLGKSEGSRFPSFGQDFDPLECPFITPVGCGSIPGALAPPMRYDVWSAGVRRGEGRPLVAEGGFLAAEELFVGSQEDFENYMNGVFLASRGITVPLNESPSDVQARRSFTGGARDYPSVETFCWEDERSYPASGNRFKPREMMTVGALSLASRQNGILDSRFYWPMKIGDFDGRVNNGGRVQDWTDAQEGDFWHEGLDPNQDARAPSQPIRPLAGLDTYDHNSFGMSVGNVKLNEVPCLSAMREVGMVGSGRQELAMDELSIAASFRPGSRLALRGDYQDVNGVWQDWAVELEAIRGATPPPPFDSNKATGTMFQAVMKIGHGQPTANFFQEDAESHPMPWAYPVVFTLKPAKVPIMGFFFWGYTFQMHVNGSLVAEKTVFGWLPPPARGSLYLESADEVRLYPKALDTANPGEILALGGHDIFERSGHFKSPLYTLDRPCRIHRASFRGVVPQGFPVNVDAMTMKVTVWDHAGAQRDITIEHPDEILDLASLGEVAAFRYRVVFDCSLVPGPLRDAPVFEGAWFELIRPGRTSVWTRLEVD